MCCNGAVKIKGLVSALWRGQKVPQHTYSCWLYIQLYKYTVCKLFPYKSHHNQPEQTVCRRNTLHTANMDNMLPFRHGQTWEFALGLLTFVTETSRYWWPRSSQFKFPNDQRGVKPYLLLSRTETWMAPRGLPRADDISQGRCGLPARECHILRDINVGVAQNGMQLK